LVPPDQTRQCGCNEGRAGKQCQIAESCGAGFCGVGGVAVETPVDTGGFECRQCSCVGQWQGSRCDECPLSCLHGGKPDKECGKCVCGVDSGYFGAKCQCRYIFTTLDILMDATWLSSGGLEVDAKISHFSQTLATDVSNSLRITRDRVEVTQVKATGKSLIAVQFELRERCTDSASVAWEYPGFGGVPRPSLVENRRLLTASATHLHGKEWRHLPTHARGLKGVSYDEIYGQTNVSLVLIEDGVLNQDGDTRSLEDLDSELRKLFSDRKSKAFRGLITTYAVFDSVTVVNPHTKAEGGEEASSFPFGIIIAVVLVLLLFVVLFLMRGKIATCCEERRAAKNRMRLNGNRSTKTTKSSRQTTGGGLSNEKVELGRTQTSTGVKLPPGWSEETDDQGRQYYYHAADDTSQWTVPEGSSYDAFSSGTTNV